MKKFIVILLSIILAISVVGCSNNNEELNQQYEDAMSNGKSKVIEEEYDKAIDYFELALESKKEDKEAMNLIEQLKLLEESIEAEAEREYFHQIKQLEKINSIDTETNVVKDKANEYKKIAIQVIDNTITEIGYDIEEGFYNESQEKLEELIKECKEIDSLKERLDKCNKLLELCKEKKKELENNSNDYYSEEGYCIRGDHYTDEENIIEGFNSCRGCQIRRDFSSTSTYEECYYCGEYGVSQFSGKCTFCGTKVHKAVKDIYDDGTIVYEDGTREKFY